MIRLMSLALASALLVACTEKPQTTTARKADDQPWDGTATAYTAPGYKGGDQAGWEKQINSRAQSQNEYNRTTSR